MPLTIGTGIFSGLNTEELINGLMSIERRPLQVYNTRKGTNDAKISAFGTLKSTLSSLSDSLKNLKSDKIYSMSAVSGSDTVFTAAATTDATVGSYNLKVSRLATAQSFYSAPFYADSSPVADLSVNATQTLRMTVGTLSKDITVNSANNTLKGIRDAINSAAIGAKASIVNYGFTVDATNKTLLFNDGADRTATLTEGTYTAEELSAEVKRAMEAANGSVDTYSVAYSSSAFKFTLSNNTGNTNAVDLLVEHASTTAEGLLGFSATNLAPVAVGGSVTGDSAVGGNRLVLTAEKTGTNNRISIKVDEDNNGLYEEATAETDTTALSRLGFNPSYDSTGAITGGTYNMTQSQGAVDALVVLDGLTATRNSNTISDLISGVTLNLKKVDTTTAYSLSVSRNDESVIASIKDFVGKYNAAVSMARGLSSADKNGKSLLAGDNVTRGVVIDLKNINVKTYGTYTPASLGLSHNKQGILVLNESVLKGFLKNDFSNVVSSLDGMAKDAEKLLTQYTSVNIPSRTDGLKKSNNALVEKSAALNSRLLKQEEALVKRFTAMENTLGSLKSSSDFLGQQLGNLNFYKKR